MIEFKQKLINDILSDLKEYRTNNVEPETNQLMLIEDLMGCYGVFYNLLRGKDDICHSDSYMSGINYEQLDKVINKLKPIISKELAEFCIDYWMNIYGVVNLKIIAIKLKKELTQTTK